MYAPYIYTWVAQGWRVRSRSAPHQADHACWVVTPSCLTHTLPVSAAAPAPQVMFGRTLAVSNSANGCAWFKFEELCARPWGQPTTSPSLQTSTPCSSAASPRCPWRCVVPTFVSRAFDLLKHACQVQCAPLLRSSAPLTAVHDSAAHMVIMLTRRTNPTGLEAPLHGGPSVLRPVSGGGREGFIHPRLNRVNGQDHEETLATAQVVVLLLWTSTQGCQ